MKNSLVGKCGTGSDKKEKIEIYICSIKNVMAEEALADGSDFESRLRQAAPVISVSTKYFPVQPKALGDWGDWKGEK